MTLKFTYKQKSPLVVGSKVRLQKGKYAEDDMLKYIGKSAVITRKHKTQGGKLRYYIDIDSSEYEWYSDEIIPIE